MNVLDWQVQYEFLKKNGIPLRNFNFENKYHAEQNEIFKKTLQNA